MKKFALLTLVLGCLVLMGPANTSANNYNTQPNVRNKVPMTGVKITSPKNNGKVTPNFTATGTASIPQGGFLLVQLRINDPGLGWINVNSKFADVVNGAWSVNLSSGIGVGTEYKVYAEVFAENSLVLAVDEVIPLEVSNCCK